MRATWASERAAPTSPSPGQSVTRFALAETKPHAIKRSFPESKLHDEGTIKLPPYLVDTAETRKQRAGYFDLITKMDRKVGETRETHQTHPVPWERTGNQSGSNRPKFPDVHANAPKFPGWDLENRRCR